MYVEKYLLKIFRSLQNFNMVGETDTKKFFAVNFDCHRRPFLQGQGIYIYKTF